MEVDAIYIRNARKSDVEDIFWLLHSESIPWDTDKIASETESLYVLTLNGKLICVAACGSKGGRTSIEWTAVHPMYPEALLSSAVNDLLSCLLLRHGLYPRQQKTAGAGLPAQESCGNDGLPHYT